jgi:hypothetical protein
VLRFVLARMRSERVRVARMRGERVVSERKDAPIRFFANRQNERAVHPCGLGDAGAASGVGHLTSL